jgi:hypothetical protein|tara:strand:- start:98 stop:817 length:720 start_codon:yes stop_codon:yes gene_type:complete
MNNKVIKLDKPYPAVAIDDFVSPALLRAAANSYPDPTWDGWYTYDGNTSDNMALKDTTRDRESITAPALAVLDYIATHFNPADYFEDFGIDIDVFPDFGYYGAGMHILPENGFLGMHVDTDIHGGNKVWTREYSAVLCASEEHDSSFDLLLHDGNKNHGRVPYKFNRLMVFKCSNATFKYKHEYESWHGIPNPITSGMTRKTLPVFYWSKNKESVKGRRARAFFKNDSEFSNGGKNDYR